MARTLYNTPPKNAEQFLADTILLMKKKSYGYSYALAVLIFEEWTK
ncbi:MAG: AbiV family abortive infection protein [Candidatus Hodarchaeales archaeon]